MSDSLLTTREAARFFGLKPATLERWRYIGDGPKFVKVGEHAVRYFREDLESFLKYRINTANNDFQ